MKNPIAKAVCRRYGAPAVPLKEASSKNGRTTQKRKQKGNAWFAPLGWYSEGAVPPTDNRDNYDNKNNKVAAAAAQKKLYTLYLLSKLSVGTQEE